MNIEKMNLDYPHFLGENPNYGEANFVVIPAPLEYTVSYGKGTTYGPYKILEASYQLETYDIETDRELIKKGIYTVNPVIFTGNIEQFELEAQLSIKRVLEAGKFPIVLGGEHSITPMFLAPYREFYSELSVLHFDAHLDLRQEYEGTKYSHACAMRRVYDELGITSISSVGIRSLASEEKNFIDEHESVNVFYADGIYKGLYDSMDILDTLSKNVYLSFDVDALDPSIVPSTGTPEPGGLTWYKTLEILRTVATNRKIVGLDIVELAPDGVNHYSEFTVAKLLYKILNYV